MPSGRCPARTGLFADQHVAERAVKGRENHLVLAATASPGSGAISKRALGELGNAIRPQNVFSRATVLAFDQHPALAGSDLKMIRILHIAVSPLAIWTIADNKSVPLGRRTSPAPCRRTRGGAVTPLVSELATFPAAVRPIGDWLLCRLRPQIAPIVPARRAARPHICGACSSQTASLRACRYRRFFKCEAPPPMPRSRLWLRLP
jgi:hypothetical protein